MPRKTKDDCDDLLDHKVQNGTPGLASVSIAGPPAVSIVEDCTFATEAGGHLLRPEGMLAQGQDGGGGQDVGGGAPFALKSPFPPGFGGSMPESRLTVPPNTAQ